MIIFYKFNTSICVCCCTNWSCKCYYRVAALWWWNRELGTLLGMTHWDCGPNVFVSGGNCSTTCPEGTYPGGGHCLPCYYMCKTCMGPNDYECASCHGDAILVAATGGVELMSPTSGAHSGAPTSGAHLVTATEASCYPKALSDSLVHNTWYYRMFIALIANLIVLIVLGVYLVAQSRNCRSRCCPQLGGKRYLKNILSPAYVDEKAPIRYNLAADHSESD